MSTYRITSAAGVDLGEYEGSTEQEALDAMAQDAGYPNQAYADQYVDAPFEGTVAEIRAEVAS